MTVIGFAVSTMFIVFVCTKLICARIQLNASRRSFHITSRSDLSIKILTREAEAAEADAEAAQAFAEATMKTLKGRSSNPRVMIRA